MKKHLILVLLIFLGVQSWQVWAYEGKVHKAINERAAKASQLDHILKNGLGMNEGIDSELFRKGEVETISDWIARGGELEDYGINGGTDYMTTRAYNHFHDPLKDWDEAALDNFALTRLYRLTYPRAPASALLWSLSPGAQDFSDGTFNWTDGLNDTGDWSWVKARNYYYQALTSETEDERKQRFADCFRALGQVMHLLQDMSVPLHTRNDAHLNPFNYIRDTSIGFLSWTYETYTKANLKELIDDGFFEAYFPDSVLLNDPQPDPGYGDLVAVSGLFDRNQYRDCNAIPANIDGIGLAEYTNANFLTQDTMWTYQHPCLTDTNYTSIDWLNPESIMAEDGKIDDRVYIRKIKGDAIGHLAAIDYWTIEYDTYDAISNAAVGNPFILDEVCWREYAGKLLPRAVGYSAALLDYFFRGRMDIRDAVLKKGSDGSISGMEFEVKNTTPSGKGEAVEPFENGSLALSGRYVPAGQEAPVFVLAEDIYTIAGAGDPINSDYVPLTATFANPVAMGARDLSFTLVFRGKLGQEEGAVAARKLPLFNSRIAYFFRPGGYGNESNIFTVLADGTDIRQITDASGPYPSYGDPAWSSDGTKLAFVKETCSDPNPDHFLCNNGKYYDRGIIVVDLTSEASYPDNVLASFLIIDEEHPGYTLSLGTPSFSPDGKQIVAVFQDEGILDIHNSGLVILEVDTGTWRYVNDRSYWNSKTPASSEGFRTAAVWTAVWSLQGDKIAYCIYQWKDAVTNEGVDKGDIYLINPDGTGDMKLTDDDYYNTQPAWSPDGQRLVFVSDRDGEGFMDIWIMDRTGGNMRKVCDCDPGCNRPSFSPDGLNIAFEQSGEIFAVNSDGNGLARITTSGYLTGAPAWSPLLSGPGVTLSANPLRIASGESSTLTWSSSNADSASMDNGIGDVEENGSVVVSPVATTTYNLLVSGPGGTAAASATVTVTTP